ncbi:glucose-methanol-choline oxidoreductase [Candidatus Koribacter versatilis Ellin345]|uniref:Glucose-methanol-choline oxidoreductase n=1 Tax=Koribacter versatilis (strain Ellin345) TaxID=204669 RepID=Q1IN91_KORVE|nr:GMC family oxidoreductase [Candidatus Koribacter versatilis]ABF41659.1 glucose-methanol-choline oxidoreductase [Candidatus Koribacter versatilis Ellin345]
MKGPQFRNSETVDFIVVGAGAAGGVMAKELAVAGFSLVVLEQGPYLSEEDFGHDEIKFAIQKKLTNDTKIQPITYRKTEAEVAKPFKAIEYGRQVGGGSVHFTANYWRLHESDFHERSLWGEVQGSTFDDWPIRYGDLEPYYTKAEEELGISGLGGANPFEAPRSKPYPLPPMPVKSSGVLFERATKKMGLHPYPAPVAVLSQPYRGSGACVHCGMCELFGCEMKAKSSTLVSVIPIAEKSGRCEIRPNSYVRKLETDASGRVTGVIYFDAQKQEVLQRAKAVVLCANGVESAKLLLMSKSNRFPQGLANSSGLVGKNLMWDNGTESSGLFEHPLNEFKSVQVTRVIHDYYDADRKRGFYGGGGIDARFDFYPITFALTGLPDDAPTWGLEFKKTVGKYFTRTMTLLAHATSLPRETNSVSLDPQMKDAWGLPAVRITFDWHPDDIANMKWLVEREREILQVAGAQKVWSFPVEPAQPNLMPSRHLIGTCRMGRDPKKSVVDPFGHAHDVPNLFIVDGSNFVTSGRQQPTATIQALAYRAAERIAGKAKAGEL